MTDVVTDDPFADLDDPEPEDKPKVARRRSTSPRAPSKRVTTLQSALTQQMFQAGTVIGLAMPATGYYIAQESDQFCGAITRLASKDPRYLEALENLASIGPGVIIGRTVIGIGCAIGTDRYHRSDGERGIDPAKRVAMLLGVSQAYYEVYGEDGMQDAASNAGFAAPPPAARFAPIPG